LTNIVKRSRQVFLSYAKEDVEFARKLYAELQGKFFGKIWFDEESLIPGQNWKKEISKAIKTSDIFIALISRNSVNKRGIVQKELKEAIDVMKELPEGKIYLIPVRLDNVTPSYDFLHDIHWINLFKDWNRGIHQIWKAIILDFYEDKASAMTFTEVNLEQILTNVLKLIKHTSKDKGHQLIFKNCSSNPIVLGNEEMLTQVFHNIIINAINFSIPKNKTSEPEVLVKLYENGLWVFVQVQNYGQPIVEDDILHGRIFEPFFTTSSTGTGLGLAVTKMLVEKHGGTIFAISTPATDSLFEKTQTNLFLTTFAIALPRIINRRKD